jgi:hypothetical protein
MSGGKRLASLDWGDRCGIGRARIARGSARQGKSGLISGDSIGGTLENWKKQ